MPFAGAPPCRPAKSIVNAVAEGSPADQRLKLERCACTDFVAPRSAQGLGDSEQVAE